MQKTRGSLMEPTLTTIAYFLFAGFAVGLAVGWWAALQRKDDSVSYTHLTLPTIYSV